MDHDDTKSFLGDERRLRKLIAGLAGVVAATVATIIPAIFFLTAYLYESERLARAAEIDAVNISRRIFSNPELWRFEFHRLEEIVIRGPSTAVADHHLIFDQQGKVIAKIGDARPGPVLRAEAFLSDGLQVVGRVQVSTSLWPVLIRTGWAALVSTGLAVATWVVLRVLPLRIVDRTLARLAESQAELDARVVDLSSTNARLKTEITERKEAQAQLVQASTLFNTAFEQDAMGMALRAVDPYNSRWLRVNQKFCDMFGYTREELLQLTSVEISLPDERHLAVKYNKLLLRGDLSSYSREKRYLRKDGTVIWTNVWLSAVHDPEGNPTQIISVIQDITERKEAQAQLVQATKMATLGEMASNIAHELNQPLTVVGMAAQNSLLGIEEDGCDIDFLRGKLATIVEQTHRMGGIVNHMRLFSRKDEANLESFDPVNSVGGAVGLIAKQLEGSGIELEEDLPATCRNVSGHPSRLEQVVLNLLTNARDAVLGKSDSAKFVNRNPAPTVRVSLVDDTGGNTVVISVADNGGGISEDVLERVFDPFFTTKSEGHGTGLGLSISYSIIDAMGGRLEAKNTDGGVMFRITLPVSAHGPGAVARPPNRKRAKPRPGNPGSTLPRILFVDDEKDIVAEVAEYLVYEGYDVATAGNGWEALELHKSRPADVVITDWLMPGMGGNELIRRLRETEPDLPILVMTGHTTFGDDQDIVAEGASVVLKKPIDLRELTERMRQMVGE